MIFAINTSTIHFSLALLLEDGNILAEYLLSPNSGNLQPFMPALDSILRLSDTDLHDIQAIIIARGPGSFTGMRIGFSAAKGMAQSLQIPIIGVSSLKALAHQLPYTSYPICTLIDSRKRDIFTALFRWSDNGDIIRMEKDTCVKLEDLSSMIEEKTLFIGNNFQDQSRFLLKMIGPGAIFAPSHLWSLRASAVGALGLKRFNNREFDDLRDLIPSYLRPPDIKPNPFSPKSDDHG